MYTTHVAVRRRINDLILFMFILIGHISNLVLSQSKVYDPWVNIEVEILKARGYCTYFQY